MICKQNLQVLCYLPKSAVHQEKKTRYVNLQSIFTNLPVPVTQTVSTFQGIVHKVPHHCVLLLQPTAAPQVFGNAQTMRGHVKSQ